KLAGDEGARRPLAEVVRALPDAGGAFRVASAAPTPQDADDAPLRECLASLRPLQCATARGGSRLLVPLHCDGHALGALALESAGELDGARLLVEGFARIYANYVALLHESERDKLTGLYNRRTFDRRLQRLIEQQRVDRASARAPGATDARRPHADGAHVWLAIFDIDHFKRVNDNFGHVYGDEVILMLSQRMKACFRRSDLLFRFGGEEFVVLLEPAPEAMARRALERFRESVAAQPFPQVGQVTVSLGYARMAPGDYPILVLDRADKALYYAKQHGRNRTCGYEALVAAGELDAPHHAGSVDLF
ncbi:MAG: GGDEF domain-containing protein, partial [Mizugakiibacter sp.]|uniref:GGDEF domain-containing protein n=1 Tax=Mizugakiibacter sp. TaxID=1972610 RepID=UPI003210E4AE